MSSLEFDQLRKQIVSEISDTDEWGVHEIGLKSGVISTLVCFFLYGAYHG